MHWSHGGTCADKLSAHLISIFSFNFFFFASLVILCCVPRAIPLVPLSLAATHTIPLSHPTPRPSPTLTLLSLLPLHSSFYTLAMIMVQKPIHLLSSPSTYHRRHPSAPPVVHVQPTHIPGLLSLSKPHPVTPPRSQNQHNRQTRLSHNRPKTGSAARLSHQTPVAQAPLPEDLNKLSTPGRPSTKSHPLPVTSTVTPEKPPRGRQSSKQSKDKSKQR